jgi:hypothetical protein
MRENQNILRELFKTGLRKDERWEAGGEAGGEALELLIGMRPSPSGLRGFEPITSPVDGLIVEWPFPQLFAGSREYLLADEDVLYRLVDGELSEILTYDFDSPETLKPIVAGGSWHFIDFFSTWVLVNGSCLVIKLGSEEKVLVKESPIRTGTSFRGRAIFGGLELNQLWGTGWQEGITTEATRYQSTIDSDMTKGTNFIYWTAIGGGDLVDFLDYNRAVGDDVGDPKFFDYLRRNDSGFMPMPWAGTTYQVKPLGMGVVCYGDNGIAVLRQISEPVPTFGLQLVFNHLGVKERGAIGGDESQHLFIGTDNNLYSLNAEYRIEKLGYKEYMRLLSGEVVISFDEVEREFYITDGSRCFVYGPNGLSESRVIPTSVTRLLGELTGPLVTTTGEGEFELRTNRFDFGLRGDKHVQMIEIGGAGLTEVEGNLSYRRGGVGPFAASPWEPAPSGVLFNRNGVTSTEFKLSLRGELSNESQLEYLNLKWKMVDHRYVRGVISPSE